MQKIKSFFEIQKLLFFLDGFLAVIPKLNTRLLMKYEIEDDELGWVGVKSVLQFDTFGLVLGFNGPRGKAISLGF